MPDSTVRPRPAVRKRARWLSLRAVNSSFASDVPAAWAPMLSAFAAGDWRAAYRHAGLAAQSTPEAPLLHHVAGLAALELGHAPLAVAHLGRVRQAWPARQDVQAMLARALTEADRMDEAVALADDLLAQPGLDASVLSTLGVVYSKANLHARAMQAFARAVDADPHDANRRFDHATSLMYFGRIDEADAELEACIAADPTYWRAHLALAQLRRQTPTRNHLPRLRRLIDAHPDDVDAQLHLNLAIARELEDLGDGPRAFDHYVRGKGAVHARRGSSRAQDDAVFDAAERACTRLPHAAHGDAHGPIFILGMPRSGTTLVDRILAAHPQVESAGELGHFGAALQGALPRPPHSLADLIDQAAALGDWRAVGDDYLRRSALVAGRAPRFTDKLPHNFLYLGFIALALPGARIVWVRRGTLDTCIGNLRQLFAPESPYHRYSFDLADIAHYCARFERLMACWTRRFPGRVLELRYEDLVAAQEAQTRRLLEFCGLPWDARRLDFTVAGGPVATASAVQVREALHREGVGRWQRYGDRTQPLLDALRREGLTPEGA